MVTKKYDFEEIFSGYKQKIYRLAVSLTRNQDDAGEIVQNTFLKVMENIDKFQGRSQLSTWIYKIAYNEALQLLRKKNKNFSLTDDNLELGRQVPSALRVNWPQVPDKQLVDGEFKKRIDAAIRDLPIKYRMPLLLYGLEERSLKEIGGILGLNVNSVKTRIRRGRIFLKQEIKNYLDDNLGKPEHSDEECNFFVKFIHDYSEDVLAGEKKGRFEKHITDCPDCHDFLQGYLTAIKITSYLTCDDLPAALQQKIRTFLQQEKQ